MRTQATGGTQPHSGEPAEISPNRDDDQLLLVEEVAELMRTSASTQRYLRHQGKAPYFFKAGGKRLVAWRSDVLAFIEAERVRDRAYRATV